MNTDDEMKRINKFLAEQNKIKKIIGEDTAISKLLAENNKILSAHNELIKTLGPANQIAAYMRDVRPDEHSPYFRLDDTLSAALKPLDHEKLLGKTIAAYVSDLSHLKIAEIGRIGSQINTDWALSNLHRQHLPDIVQAMAAMKSPWVDALEVSHSIRGFAEMQTIGYALKTLPSFNSEFTDLLRMDLGDWRDPITWPVQVFADPVARTAFYVERGLNTELTDFPEDAFHESLDLAGISHEPPTLVEIYGSPILFTGGSEDEAAFTRTNKAHDWLLRLETQLRQFIDQRMTEVYGPDWAKHRLPSGLYEKWMEKKKTAEDRGGRQWPLIAYADFTEYSLVICRSDNWKEVFAPFFGRPESVRESFQRLQPIRICTMHARPISQDDQLYLYVEAHRLMKALVTGKTDPSSAS